VHLITLRVVQCTVELIYETINWKTRVLLSYFFVLLFSYTGHFVTIRILRSHLVASVVVVMLVVVGESVVVFEVDVVVAITVVGVSVVVGASVTNCCCCW
jgi:hypothetical protein